jgi:hypothetical protein
VRKIPIYVRVQYYAYAGEATDREDGDGCWDSAQELIKQVELPAGHCVEGWSTEENVPKLAVERLVGDRCPIRRREKPGE